MVAGPRTLMRHPAGAVNLFPLTVVRVESAASTSPVGAGAAEEACCPGEADCIAMHAESAKIARADMRRTILSRRHGWLFIRPDSRPVFVDLPKMRMIT